MQRLLFTGGTGFLGRNIMPILTQNYKVTTLGMSPINTIQANLAHSVPNLPNAYDIILHAAGKAHVYPTTDAERKAFYDVNYQGTINLCKALESSSLPKSFIFISTMSVYGKEPGNMDTENSRPLIGDTPYSDSKILAEQYLIKWCKKNRVILSILRPGLIVGKNPPGNLGAMIKGIKNGAYLSINHGKARKSMLVAEDIARLIPLVSVKGGIYNVCDSHNPSFKELETLIAKKLGKRPPKNLPYSMAKCLAYIGDILGHRFPINSSKLKKIVTSDTYSNDKARNELGWEPIDVLENFEL